MTNGTAGTDGAALYGQFVDAFNRRDYDALGRIMTADFTDHHPGLTDVTSLDEYRRNLAFVIDALEMRADPEEVAGLGDRVFTRIRLSGRHVGPFLGLAPTGRAVTWYTHEIWRQAGGMFVERWAVDDLFSLLAQLGVPLPQWQDQPIEA